MPPLINGDSSRLTADSKDVFIDCTSVSYLFTNKPDLLINHLLINLFINWNFINYLIISSNLINQLVTFSIHYLFDYMNN